MRMLRFHLSSAFATWAEDSFQIGVRADAARRMHRKMFIVAKRILHNKLHQAFVSWLVVLDEYRDEEARRLEASACVGLARLGAPASALQTLSFVGGLPCLARRPAPAPLDAPTQPPPLPPQGGPDFP